MNKILIFYLVLSFSTVTYSKDISLQTKPIEAILTLKNTPQPQSNTIENSSQRPYWVRPPKPIYNDGDLEGKPRTALIKFETDTTGKIINATITKSSGVTNLDNILLNSVYRARMSIYEKNGVVLPIRATQPFEIAANDYSSSKKSNFTTVKSSQKTCKFNLIPEILKLQKKQTKTPFIYQRAPHFYIYENELKSEPQNIQFTFHLSKSNTISNVKITKSSGSNNIDARFLVAMKSVQVQAPRKFLQWSTFQLTDEIKFNIETKECIQTYDVN